MSARAVQARLDAIDERLRAIDEHVATCTDLKTTVDELQQQVAVLAARPATAAGATGQAAARSGAPAADAPRGEPLPPGLWSRLASPAGTEKRAELAALGDEYRARKAELDEELGASATAAERQHALADLNKWYGERLRELLVTEPWPAQGADTK